jgi:hypothetical protein
LVPDPDREPREGMQVSCNREAVARIVRGHDQVSAVSFENTDAVYLFFTGFERKKEAVSMVLADIFKSALQ